MYAESPSSVSSGGGGSFDRRAIMQLQRQVRELQKQVAELQGRPTGDTVEPDAERDKALYGGAA